MPWPSPAVAHQLEESRHVALLAPTDVGDRVILSMLLASSVVASGPSGHVQRPDRCAANEPAAASHFSHARWHRCSILQRAWRVGTRCPLRSGCPLTALGKHASKRSAEGAIPWCASISRNDREPILAKTRDIHATGGKTGRVPVLWAGRSAERIAAHLTRAALRNLVAGGQTRRGRHDASCRSQPRRVPVQSRFAGSRGSAAPARFGRHDRDAAPPCGRCLSQGGEAWLSGSGGSRAATQVAARMEGVLEGLKSWLVGDLCAEHRFRGDSQC
ncbi:MAG: hypothetical protein ACREX3_18820 [Gammaproteobacteria bacterium]